MQFSFIEVASYHKTGSCPHRFNCCNFMLYDCCGNDCWEESLDYPDYDDPDFIG